MPRTVSSLALALGSMSAAFCAPFCTAEIDRLEEVIVTSSRVPMPLRQVATSVSVVTREEIQARGFNSLFEVLRSQPSIAASNTGGVGKPTALRIRGEEGFRTKAYIDGIDVSDTSGPQIGPRFEEMLSSGIQRVEVLRGPQGLMYGADAGGVVNITTTAPEAGFGGDVSAEAGRYGTRQVAGNIAGGNETLDFSVSGVDLETDGFNALTTDDVLRDDDGYGNTTLHGRGGWSLSDSFRIEAVLRDTDSDSEYDNCFTVDIFAPSDACISEFEQQARRLSARYQYGRFVHELAYSGSETDRQDYTEGRPSFGSSGELEQYSYLGSFDGGASLRLVYGAELRTESLDDGTFDRERDQDGYFAEYQGGFYDRLFVTAGVRYDDNEDFGSRDTYRLSAAYLIPLSGGEAKIRGAYGTGFRAPSLYEMAYNNSFGFPPASDVSLGAELSKGYDLAVGWYGENGLFLEAVYFDQSVRDEIFFDLQGFSGYLQGSGDALSRGLELVGEYTFFDSLRLTGNYTYNDTETAADEARLRRPKHLANLAIDWQLLAGALVMSAHLRAVADAEGFGGESLDDYQVVDIRASYQFAGGLSLYGRIENLFDEDYEEVPNYNTPGTSAYAGVRYSF